MKNPTKTQPATSLPRAPREDANRREMTYLIMMGIRILGFALMVLVTPYGWYTAVFAAAAIVLPYIAVVIANVSADMTAPTAESPERMIEAPPSGEPATTASDATSATPTVIRISETGSGADTSR